MTAPAFTGEGFRPLTFADGARITSLVREHGVRSCLYNFAQIHANAELCAYLLRDVEGRLLIYNSYRKKLYAPLGAALPPASLRDLARDLGGAAFHYAPESYVEAHPDVVDFFDVHRDDGEREYIYSTAALAAMTAPQFRKRRSSVSQFHRAHPSAGCRRLAADDAPECVRVATEWAAARRIQPESAEARFFNECIDFEGRGLRHALAHFGDLALDGLGLFVAGRLVAYDVFSGPVGRMIHVTYEKYDPAVPECVPPLRKATGQYLLDRGFTHFNFGRDLGFEGLRRNKRAYAPESELVNCTLRPREGAVR